MAKRKSKIMQGQVHFSAKLGMRTTTNRETNADGTGTFTHARRSPRKPSRSG
jgi:hypothetical protein